MSQGSYEYFYFHVVANSILSQDIKKRSERKMSCPLCRKEFKSPADVATLPNNDAPLHILKLKEKMKRDQELVSKPRQFNLFSYNWDHI